MITRLSDKAKKMVVKALQAEAGDERVVWELGVTAFPDPSAGSFKDEDGADLSVNAFLPVLVLYLEIPGPNELSVYGSSILPPFGLDQATVDAAVKSSLEALREESENLTKPTE
jgi:hypothetical protein